MVVAVGGGFVSLAKLLVQSQSAIVHSNKVRLSVQKSDVVQLQVAA